MKRYCWLIIWLLLIECVAGENPIRRGADPHVILADGTAWLYATYGRGGRFYAFSSPDLLTWQRHGPVLTFAPIDWIPEGKHAWAPAVAERKGTYYFYYSVGPKPSHIGAASGDSPLGPFTDSGRPLLSDHNNPKFEAIDPMVFEDPNSGRFYLYAGGSAGATLRVFELDTDMLSLKREMSVDTPPRFTEGAFMHLRNSIYYLSYSHGSWRHASYSVHYATAGSPLGPWKYRGAILQSDERYKGPGHHSFLYNPAADQWYIFYHRWEDVDGTGPYYGSRRIAVERVRYKEDGRIQPVTMTKEGVGPVPLDE